MDNLSQQNKWRLGNTKLKRDLECGIFDNQGRGRTSNISIDKEWKRVRGLHMQTAEDRYYWLDTTEKLHHMYKE